MTLDLPTVQVFEIVWRVALDTFSYSVSLFNPDMLMQVSIPKGQKEII